jgi:hypothetical protein
MTAAVDLCSQSTQYTLGLEQKESRARGKPTKPSRAQNAMYANITRTAAGLDASPRRSRRQLQLINSRSHTTTNVSMIYHTKYDLSYYCRSSTTVAVEVLAA